MNEKFAKTIHETVLRDIFDIAKGLKDEDEVKRIANYNSRTSFKSINNRAEALTLVFPCAASKNCSYESSARAAKAIEQKAVSLLTMLFAAIQITDADDAFDYVKKFHTNLDNKAFGVDDFLDTMDMFVSENCSHLNEENEVATLEAYEKIKKDMAAMNFYFEFSPISEFSLGDYKVITMSDNGKMIVNEADRVPKWTQPKMTTTTNAIDPVTRLQYPRTDEVIVMPGNIVNGRYVQDPMYVNTIDMHKLQADAIKANNQASDMEFKQKMETDKFAYMQGMDANRQEFERDKLNHTISSDEQKAEADRLKFRHQQNVDAERQRMDRAKYDMEMSKLITSVNQNRLVPQDAKKANELQPTLMTVNFISKGDANSTYPIYSSFVVGVKAKLTVCDGMDILNRFKIKHNSKNLMLNLIKVSTREISFFKDFLFAIDNAKLDAVSQSRRGSSSKMWKVLERRALKSKIRRSFNMTNDATSITSIIITSDEVEFFKKTEYIDLEAPKVINNIMEAYNLLHLVILDDNLEIAKIVSDTGDGKYELITYNNMEKEQKDNSKKILNLMSKMR